MEHPGRILAIVFLAVTLIAADHLYYLNKPREILIKGSLCLAPAQPIPGVQVDAYFRFRGVRLKVNPAGQLAVALRILGVAKMWSHKAGPLTPYSISWRKNGQFDLSLRLCTRTTPRNCRLVFHFPNGATRRSPRIRLRAGGRQRSQLSGQCPPLILAQLPTPPKVIKRKPKPVEAAEITIDVPESDLGEVGYPVLEEKLIRDRAEEALLHINTLSLTKLKIRYHLIQYLESSPIYQKSSPTERTKRIGILLLNMLQKRTELLSMVCSGQPAWLAPSDQDATDLKEDEEVEEMPAPDEVEEEFVGEDEEEEEEEVSPPVGD